ncbi:hypothetical protein FRC02_000311 [Tulasnella sp. 418]|nr:hypothetical protein FRC02_000311 [Tulasnella sp. 418]
MTSFTRRGKPRHWTWRSELCSHESVAQSYHPVERLVRECNAQGDILRIIQIIDQLVELFANTAQPLHCRNGGLIGLAATAIALGVEISPYMDKFIDPLLRCFSDLESRIRYFACESMYNIAKVSKGEILVYFNPIFDSLSKLAADSEISVKNGAELLDRLLKDIVAESAPIHFPLYPETEKVRQRIEEKYGAAGGVLIHEKSASNDEYQPHKRAFSLAAFIPLLAERIQVVSPFTRSYLVSWIQVLDSVPDLELVTFLPEFLEGLLQYLSDPTADVRVATENLLAEFLQEVRDIAIAQKRREEKLRQQKEKEAALEKSGKDVDQDNLPDITVVMSGKASFIAADEDAVSVHDSDSEGGDEMPDRDTGAWMPGQGVSVDHAAIVEILIRQLDPMHEDIQQSTALRWIAEFLDFAPTVMVPFTPRLIPAILPNLAHHIPSMQSAAVETNQSLFTLIQNLPSPSTAPLTTNLPASSTAPSVSAASSQRALPASPPTSSSPQPQISRQGKEASKEDFPPLAEGLPILEKTAPTPTIKSRSLTTPSDGGSSVSGTVVPNGASSSQQNQYASSNEHSPSRPQSPTISVNLPANTAQDGVVLQQSPVSIVPAEELDPFDYQTTVDQLTIQFMSEHEETRVTALKWLIMLHQKAPKKVIDILPDLVKLALMKHFNQILAMDDGTFPALLKTLSDSSEEVIKHDLQLLAQISSTSEEGYFRVFMHNLLELFSTDRRLLEARGSLIIRQLCISLSTDRIYRTFAEILEKEEDLEFASIMVQKLNIILITSPELSEFRKRLKNLESRDGQAIFSILYRSWCHNAVAVLSLCLLAQAYEHASNLLQIL